MSQHMRAPGTSAPVNWNVDPSLPGLFTSPQFQLGARDISLTITRDPDRNAHKLEMTLHSKSPGSRVNVRMLAHRGVFLHWLHWVHGRALFFVKGNKTGPVELSPESPKTLSWSECLDNIIYQIDQSQIHFKFRIDLHAPTSRSLTPRSPPPATERTYPLVGLLNPGCICYVNSTIQILFPVAPLSMSSTLIQ
jgi:hypothetical protein